MRGACATLAIAVGLLPVPGCAGRTRGVSPRDTEAISQPEIPPPPPRTEAVPSTVGALAPADKVRPYRIGADDELDISVYGEADLSKTQTVRPDGKIAFPLVGDVQAAGLTPDELRTRISDKLVKFVKNPRVTVIVAAYKSKRVSVLGEVKRPGVVPLSGNTTLLEGISRAGGITQDADLEGALLVRDGHVLPVNFEKLLRAGAVAENNLPLQPADVVLIPNVAAKKVFVLGEVQRPLVASLKYSTNVVEIIAMAGGFTRDAEKTNVLVVRGGLGNPTLLKVDVDAITKNGKLDQNLALRAGDIVYAPRSRIGDLDHFFQHISTWLQPIVLAETGIFLGPDVSSVLQNGRTVSGTAVSVNPK